MKNFIGPVIKHIIPLPYILCLFLITASEGQEIAEEIQIIGKDTRVFAITGDRASTVKYIPVPVSLPQEKRGIETSRGLIGEDQRLWRSESFTVTEGPYMRADIFSGSRTLADIWGKASLDKGKKAGTVQLLNRQAEEHTKYNTAPLTQEIGGTGYFGMSGTRFSASFVMARETDDLSGNRFRFRDREARRYKSDITVRTTLMKSWDVTGRFNLNKSMYKDFEIPYDSDEIEGSGKITAIGELYNITVVINSIYDFNELGEDSGSFFSSGVKGLMLPWDNFGFQIGAKLFGSKAPGEDTEVRIYPEASLDWAVSGTSFVKISYTPSVISHSFSDLYAQNGLINPLPMLFEDNKSHVESEIGWRFKPGCLISIGMFHTKSENALVFNRSGNFFDVPGDTSVDLTGFKLRTRYTREGIWGCNGELVINDASCTYPVPGGEKSGDAPYIPGIKTSLQGYIVMFRHWTLNGSLNFMGTHSVEIGSGDEVDSFFTIDCGIERELWKYLSVYADVKNITNSEGAWWTNRYQIPGIGLYAGFKARY